MSLLLANKNSNYSLLRGKGGSFLGSNIPLGLFGKITKFTCLKSYLFFLIYNDIIARYNFPPPNTLKTLIRCLLMSTKAEDIYCQFKMFFYIWGYLNFCS